jgi:hypothetical protein
VKEPFAVINADDFYGRDAFEKACKFLSAECDDKTWSIIGYELLNTLSEHGTVNRGVCQVDNMGNLISIQERLNIHQKDGKVVCDDGQEPHEIPRDSKVSMNFCAFHLEYLPIVKSCSMNFLTNILVFRSQNSLFR